MTPTSGMMMNTGKLCLEAWNAYVEDQHLQHASSVPWLATTLAFFQARYLHISYRFACEWVQMQYKYPFGMRPKASQLPGKVSAALCGHDYFHMIIFT